MSIQARMSKLRAAIENLRENTSGVAMVEFAFSAPIVLAMGLLGAETANYTITHMQMSQLAMQVADNASRVGESSVLTARRVFENDINETFVGGEKLGDSFDIYAQGRVIISSLQQNSDNGQWIAWQRCRGAKNFVSKYGTEGTGATGTSFPGMGEPSNRITASSGTAVIFVELSYTYDALTPFDFLDGEEIEYTAAFNVRDNRDLSQLYGADAGQPVASCSTFSADRAS